MYCPQCGTQLPEDARFCFMCGQRLDDSFANDAGIENATVLTGQQVKEPSVGYGVSSGSAADKSGSTDRKSCPFCGMDLPARERRCPACGRLQPTDSDGPSLEWSAQSAPIPVLGIYDEDTDDYRRFAAEQRSFTTPAVLTLVLYIFLWLPGFIANIVYWREATHVERITGRAPEGKGCLVAMLWVFVLVPLFLWCVFFGGLGLLTGHKS